MRQRTVAKSQQVYVSCLCALSGVQQAEQTFLAWMGQRARGLCAAAAAAMVRRELHALGGRLALAKLGTVLSAVAVLERRKRVLVVALLVERADGLTVLKQRWLPTHEAPRAVAHVLEERVLRAWLSARVTAQMVGRRRPSR
jgi:hypothetical protein